MPDVPTPEDCPSMGDLLRTLSGRDDDRSWEREWAALDVRYAADSRPGGRLTNDHEPARTADLGPRLGDRCRRTR